MKTLNTAGIPSNQLDELKEFASSLEASTELRDVLENLIVCAQAGSELVTVDPSTTFTPNEAAQRLGMSRTHLYKLLDRGEIVFHRVGRDRRIRLEDLTSFEKQRQNDRRELAERFAHQAQTTKAAIDEIADLL